MCKSMCAYSRAPLSLHKCVYLSQLCACVCIFRVCLRPNKRTTDKDREIEWVMRDSSDLGERERGEGVTAVAVYQAIWPVGYSPSQVNLCSTVP